MLGVFEVAGSAIVGCAAGLAGGAAVGAAVGFGVEQAAEYMLGRPLDCFNTVDGAGYGAIAGGVYFGSLPVSISIRSAIIGDEDDGTCPA